jgi:transmembrane E3 ubiquitin-protein ligase
MILFVVAYFLLLHVQLSTESLFNAFATAAFFKFVVFSIFEMRYLLAIWKANRVICSIQSLL